MATTVRAPEEVGTVVTTPTPVTAAPAATGDGGGAAGQFPTGAARSAGTTWTGYHSVAAALAVDVLAGCYLLFSRVAPAREKAK
jgi:hypothetical protein